MFSSNKKSKNVKKKETKPDNDMMNMFGLGMDMDVDDDDDDEGLEAELAALQGRPVQKKKPQKKEKIMSMDEITKLASDSMKDISDGDDDDIEDEDLLAELHELVPDENEEEVKVEAKAKPQQMISNEDTGITLIISQRKEMYKQAHENAKTEGASSKVRRLERGLKELDKLLKDAKAGKSIKEDDIPPPVAVKAKSGATSVAREVASEVSQETSHATSVQQKPDQHASLQEPIQEDVSSPAMTDAVTRKKPDDDNDATVKMLTARRDQYKMAALAKKRENDIQAAKHLLAVAKQFDPVISAMENGQAVDLSKLPPPPGEAEASASPATSTATSTPQPQPQETPKQQVSPPKDTGPPSAPSSVLEALQQRCEKYQQSADQAKAEGNGSKARRMGRIAKQYQDAIRDHKRGKSINFEELPAPPGFAPIPGTEGANQDDSSAGQIAAAASSAASPAAAAQATSVNVTPPQNAQVVDKPPQIEVRAGSSETMSRNQKELQFLLTRQKEFKIAALQAKKNGDLDTAKHYLRQSKGMDEMIVAAQSGLRVDITTVPSLKKKEKKPSESENDDFEHVKSVPITDEHVELDEDVAGLYARLEAALKKQIKASEENAKHYKLLGDLAAAKNFDTLHRASQQDLDTVIMSKSHRHPVPKFHYEMKSFPIVRSHPELSDSELEINIIRCINIPLPSGYQPKDMYSYVNYEFPFPNDAPQTGSTSVIKNTINPEFNQNFKVSIDRKNRALTRILRRQPLNLKVMYQRGFLKSDKALGQANIKLEQFNNKSTIHECIELMDVDRGRRPVGGKIEVMLKLRQPFVDKDVEVVNEKWLVLDSHLRTLEIQSTTMNKSPSMPHASSPQYKSLEVSKFEKEVTEKQIAAIKTQGKSVPSVLLQKLEDAQGKIREIQTILKQGGNPALEYMKQLQTGQEIEKSKAQKCLQNGDKSEAKMCLARKKILEREIASMRR